MNDEIATVEQRVDGLQRELAAFDRDMEERVARSFKWTIATVVVGILATWFGVFMFLTRGAAQLRKLLQAS